MLTPEDSDLVLAAYPGAKPVLSGGRPIAGWKEVTVEGKKLWAADIPEARDGKWLFRELWVNGQRATRARHPNRGYLAIAELPDKANGVDPGPQPLPVPRGRPESVEHRHQRRSRGDDPLGGVPPAGH